jgi:hypothetical protein
VLAELADRPFDGVALLISGGVEGGRAAALTAAPAPVGRLVCGLGDGGFDAAAAQVSPGPSAGVRLIAEHPPRPGPGTARAPAGDLKPAQERAEGQGIVALPRAGDPGQRPTPRIGEQVDLAGQPAAGPA